MTLAIPAASCIAWGPRIWLGLWPSTCVHTFVPENTTSPPASVRDRAVRSFSCSCTQRVQCTLCMHCGFAVYCPMCMSQLSLQGWTGCRLRAAGGPRRTPTRLFELTFFRHFWDRPHTLLVHQYYASCKPTSICSQPPRHTCARLLIVDGPTWCRR